MYKKIIIYFVLLSLFLTGCSSSYSGDMSLLSINDSGKITSDQSLSYDWKEINIKGGKVEHVFTFKNDGEEDLIIKSVVTTCMCTSAVVQLADGTTSPEFSMHGLGQWGAKVHPDEEFQIKAVFDPMAHGPDATGPITRMVIMETSSVANDDFATKDPLTTKMLTKMQLEGNVLSEGIYERTIKLNGGAGNDI